MVKPTKSNFRKNRNPKGSIPNSARAKKINASTAFDTCSEQLSPFGGLLPLIKFLDLVDFHKKFPVRQSHAPTGGQRRQIRFAIYPITASAFKPTCWANFAGAKPSAANKPQRSSHKSKNIFPIALTKC